VKVHTASLTDQRGGARRNALIKIIEGAEQRKAGGLRRVAGGRGNTQKEGEKKTEKKNRVSALKGPGHEGQKKATAPRVAQTKNRKRSRILRGEKIGGNVCPL